MFGFTSDRRDRDILAASAELAGHLDLYVCRNFRRLRDREPHEVPTLLSRGLIKAGVDSRHIHVEPDPDMAVDAALGLARPGDPVLPLVGSSEFDDLWRRLRERVGRLAENRAGAARQSPA